MKPGFLDPYSPYVSQATIINSSQSPLRFAQQDEDFYVAGGKVSFN